MKAGDKCSECKRGILHDKVSRQLSSKYDVEYYLFCSSCMIGFFKPTKALDVVKLNFVVGGVE